MGRPKGSRNKTTPTPGVCLSVEHQPRVMVAITFTRAEVEAFSEYAVPYGIEEDSDEVNDAFDDAMRKIKRAVTAVRGRTLVVTVR